MKTMGPKAALWTFFLFATILLLVPFSAQAKFPEQAINLIVPYAPGGGIDTVCRTLAEVAKDRFGQPVVILNKPGAATATAMVSLKNSKPDGYTLGAVSAGAVLTPYLYGAEYDIYNDFTHVMQISSNVLGLTVNAESPWKTLESFFEQTRKQGIVYASTPRGSPNHLNMEQLAYLNKVKTRGVFTKGDAESITLLLGKNVDATVTSAMVFAPQVKAGNLRSLILFSEKRLEQFPDVPSVKELNYDVEMEGGLLGIAGPKGLPRDILDEIHQVFRESMKDPRFIKTMASVMSLIIYRGPEDWVSYLKKYEKDQLTIIKRLGLMKK